MIRALFLGSLALTAKVWAQHWPFLNGTVDVVDAFAKTLDEKALIAVNDLGPAREDVVACLIQRRQRPSLDAHPDRGSVPR